MINPTKACSLNLCGGAPGVSVSGTRSTKSKDYRARKLSEDEINRLYNYVFVTLATSGKLYYMVADRLISCDCNIVLQTTPDRCNCIYTSVIFIWLMQPSIHN